MIDAGETATEPPSEWFWIRFFIYYFWDKIARLRSIKFAALRPKTFFNI